MRKRTAKPASDPATRIIECLDEKHLLTKWGGEKKCALADDAFQAGLRQLKASSAKRRRLLRSAFQTSAVTGEAIAKRLSGVILHVPIPHWEVGQVLLMAALESVDENDRQGLLDEVFFGEHGDFWGMAPFGRLPVGRGLLTPQSLLEFFRKGVQMIHGNMGGSDFMQIVEVYARDRPDDALVLLEKIMEDSSVDEAPTLLTHLLGALRTAKKKPATAVKLVTLEQQLEEESDWNRRRAWYSAWLVTHRAKAPPWKRCQEIIEPLLSASSEELGEAVHLVLGFMRSKTISSAFLFRALGFLLSLDRGQVTDSIQHMIIDRISLFLFSLKHPRKRELAKKAAELLVLLQPIPAVHLGTWKCCLDYLTHLLEIDEQIFLSAFEAVVLNNDEDTVRAILKENELSRVTGALAARDCTAILVQTMFHRDERLRITGLHFFTRLSGKELPPDSCNGLRDEQVLLVLFQGALEINDPNHISRLLRFLRPALENRAATTVREYRSELFYQACNFPGACLDEWKKSHSEDALFAPVIHEAERYFAQRRQSSEEGWHQMNDFLPPGYEAGAALANWRMRKLMSEAMTTARKKSPLLSLVPSTTLLYGNSFAHRNDEAYGPPTPFSKHGTTSESPQMWVMNPERHQIRRIHFAQRIQKLEEALH